MRPRAAISSSVQLGVKRGVMMGFMWSKRQPSSQRSVSDTDCSVVSCKMPGRPLRSMFTLPTKPVTPARSSSSMRIQVASVCREENMHTRVVPLVIRSVARRR